MGEAMRTTQVQPIWSAPKNGDVILLAFPPDPERPIMRNGGWIEGWYHSSPKGLDDGWETVVGFIGEPTHWSNLP